jgi:hypothetical protein
MVRIVSRVPSAVAALTFALFSSLAVQASPTCPDQQTTPQVPQDLKLCAQLEPKVRHPGALPLNEYEQVVNNFFSHMCHRNVQAGWKSDKRIRDTGPWIGTYSNGQWSGQYYGTHAPVLIWYSPDFYAWLKTNRPETGPAPTVEQPVPDGAIVVKEMYPKPAAACAGIDLSYLLPTSQGAAIMVRDSTVAHDGWFWGWYGWGPNSGWEVDWPASATSPTPAMGFGQYCTNCHASAKDNQTFAALRNIAGEPGKPLVFLSQNFFLKPPWQTPVSGFTPFAQPPAVAAATAARPTGLTNSLAVAPPQPLAEDNLHKRIAESGLEERLPPEPKGISNSSFVKSLHTLGAAPNRDQVVNMPPMTYDNVWVKAGNLTAASQFITSDQCVGCHSAGGTGLQYDMTQPGTATLLLNISPYGTWRGSPMGLAGRDPVFFAQLASETETFHHEFSSTVQDTCLGCHGIEGQRQFGIDTLASTGKCQPFARDTVNATPYPPNTRDIKQDPKLANYGALARDGISCAACHHMVLGNKDSSQVQNLPQNICVQQRQAQLNPGLSRFAKTITGSFFVGPPDRLYGPFDDPKTKPMNHALGIDPTLSQNIMSPELCGTCHTVHLPVYSGNQTIKDVHGQNVYVYEQTTYPEWAFSAYRTGMSPDGPLPFGAGTLAQSCQGCHMPNQDAAGHPYPSKIAAIQEYTNFPQTDNTLPAGDIDLPTRAGFAKHTLVGLNVFLLEMAEQFPAVLGIRLFDPMLTDQGVDSIPASEAAMTEQALNKTATVTVDGVRNDGQSLTARVTVINKTGHKFPSGVGFRRAFIQFDVLDAHNAVLWSSGRTNSSGVIVDDKGTPVAGEYWWNTDCSARIEPDARIHQRHYQVITRQDQTQIYQELVAAPAEKEPRQCGPDAKPAGPLTTSFLSICSKVKDNRILPHGFLSLGDRKQIAKALGGDDEMAEETDPTGVGDDPDYRDGGSDSLIYRVPLNALAGNGKPATVQATLYYQATPPFFLQDRFCTAKGADTQRLYYIAGNINLDNTPASGWKLRVVTSGPVAVP